MPLSRLSAIDPRTKWGRIYLALLLLRCLSAFFGYGYIHPDEWMQSGEPYYGLTMKGLDAQIPWEWRPDQALRSLSSLRTQYLAAPTMLQFLTSLGELSGHKLFLVQRASVLLWTLYLDVVTAFIFPPETGRYLVCLFRVSTAATTFSVRPFSNSHEANLIALLLIHVLTFYRDRSWYKWPNASGWHWGVLAAVYTLDAIFMRFTHAIFALPSLLFFAYSYYRIAKEGYVKPALKSFSIAAAAGLIALYIGLDTETKFYTQTAKSNGLNVATFWGTKWVIPPLNALLYNLKTENVAQHGLHPRWLHAVVNMPMIIGVANFVVLFIHGWRYVQDLGAKSTVKPASERAAAASRAGPSTSFAAAQSMKNAEAEVDYVDIEPVAVGLCLITIIFSLVVLSISPHQEPRFLLALAFPSTVIFAYALQSSWFQLRPALVRALVALHILQHLVQLVLFSFLHQAALLPTLFSIDRTLSHLPLGADPLSQSQRYQHHLLYRTFPPPRHLLPHKRPDMYPRIDHFDSTTTAEELIQLAAAACDHTWIYTPTWAIADLHKYSQAAAPKIILSPQQSWTWHVDMDHLVESLALVRKVGFSEAFAIQKLSVACRRSHPAAAAAKIDSQSTLDHHDEL